MTTTIPVPVAEAVPGPRPADLTDDFLLGIFRTMSPRWGSTASRHRAATTMPPLTGL